MLGRFCCDGSGSGGAGGDEAADDTDEAEVLESVDEVDVLEGNLARISLKLPCAVLEE